MADDKQEKKPVKGLVKAHALFDNGKKNHRDCPKCGKGYTLANHKGRKTCGRCGYTEFIKQEEKKE